MQVPDAIDDEPNRFFDGGTDGEPPRTLPDAAYELGRVVVALDGQPEREWFQLRRRVGYRDRHHGDLLVPRDCATFYSDLTSVPALFTWLVPKSGDHLPAALIHDGLVRAEGAPPDHIGPDMSRVDADRVFRDAMADSGTGLIRRWIVWTAVTLATIWAQQGTATSARLRTYYRWVMVATLGSIAWLGYQATADLVDRSGRWWCTYELPWITGDTWWEELLSGAVGAVAVPLVLSVPWGRFRRAGAIAGVMLGALFHVTLALVLLSGVYTVLEAVATDGRSGLRRLGARVLSRWRAVIGGATVIAAAVAACIVL
ncbi:MAG: DUF1353 domain-containing protein [Ilumatobacteraceae bacterium]|nr:DUF1353 domain-containing protein [Ilumatobacteraceae bacterium]